MATEGSHIDFMFLAPPTRPLDPLLVLPKHSDNVCRNKTLIALLLVKLCKRIFLLTL